ncbi:MAG: M1 family metallopeptidase, partial [Bacteroidota bacterium]
ESVTNSNGQGMKYTINGTMLRLDLPQPLKAGAKTTFKIKWWYNINNTREIGGRSGYEEFSDGHRAYCIAQFFPRMCSYNDVEGWQNKQFYGRGEFTLIFGDYDVEISVPKDHVVAATGELQNASSVMTSEQRSRWADAKNSYVQPVMIQTKEESMANSEEAATQYQTWKFKAKNVRDFAFATSRRFIWDAMGVKMSDGRTVMASSMWVPEGDCLWKKYSTKAVAHTVKWYSHYTFDYPYPVAYSIDGSMGMEYPMICFNYGRCESDDTYSKRMKYGHIGVIIHEVGHNWFPMIVNSDERQWTWMDEGLNTYVQYLTQQQWERNYPHRRGPADMITSYMGGDKSKISPIMSNSEAIWQFGNNAYGKPATGLNILRETVVGRELFDYAFKEYANRWKFKQPYPADFFRTIEDASGVDLDWFWKGWFYTNEHVDLAIGSVKKYNLNSGNPVANKEADKKARDEGPQNISRIREEEIEQTYEEMDPTLVDYYSEYDPLDADAIDEVEYEQFVASLNDQEKALLESGMNYNEITFKRMGGLAMPIIIQMVYTDGTTEDFKIPAEVWRYGTEEVTRVFPTEKEVESIILDPYLETADVDAENNYYPPRASTSRFELYKQKQIENQRPRENAMQRANRAKEIKP